MKKKTNQPAADPTESSASGINRNERLAAVGLLALLLILGTAIRFTQIDRESFWLDELFSVVGSSGWGHFTSARDQLLDPAPDFMSLQGARPIWTLWVDRGEDAHPPLYYILLRLWRVAFGDSETSLRGISAVMSVGCMAAFYVAIRNWNDSRSAGLWGAALLGASGMQIYFAQECRSYAQLEFFILCSAACLSQIERCGPTRRRVVLLLLASVCALLTHYAALGAIVALTGYALVVTRGGVRRAALVGLVGSLLFFLFIWGPFAFQQLHANVVGRIDYTNDPQGRSVLNILDRLAHLPLRALAVAPRQPAYFFYAFLGVAFGLAALCGLRRRRDMLPWVFLFVGTAGLVAANDFVAARLALTIPRYTFASGPPLIALLASVAWTRGKSQLAGWGRHGVPALLLIFTILSLPDLLSSQKADWRAPAALLDAEMAAGDVLVCAPGAESWQADSLYLGLDYYAKSFPRRVAFLTKPADGQLLEQLRAAPHVWTLTPAMNSASQEFLPGSQLEKAERFVGVCVVGRFKFPAATGKN